MAISGDVLDVILRIQNLRSFQRGMRSAAHDVQAVGAQAKRTDAELAAMGRKGGKGVGMMGLMTKGAKVGTLALAAMATEAYRLGVRFEREMTMVQTMAGASASEISRLRGSVLDLAKTSGQGPVELAQGLYHIESIGLRGAEAMDALKAATEGAAVGNTDLESTATALGSALLVHMKGAAGSAHDAMGQLNAIAGAGNMRMHDLVQALGTGILPAAKVAGLSLQNVGAAIALLTDEGYGASSASAQLGTALHFLYAPTKKAEGALEGIGIGQRQLVNEMNGPRGLLGALQLLRDHLDAASGGDRARQLKILGDILPGGRGRVLMLLMNQLDRYGMKINQINKTTGSFDANIKKTQETAAFRLRAAWGDLQAALVKLSDTYKDDVTDALSAVLGVATGVVGIMADMEPTVRDLAPYVGGLAAAFVSYKLALLGVYGIEKAIMAAKFIRYWYLLARAEGVATTALFAFNLMMDANPAVLMALGLMAVVAALVLMITHWKQTKHAAKDAWDWINNHWYVFAPIPIIGQLITVVHFFHKIKGAAKDAGHWIRVAFVNALNFVIEQWDKLHFSIPKIHVPGLGDVGGQTIGVYHLDKIRVPGSGPATPIGPSPFPSAAPGVTPNPFGGGLNAPLVTPSPAKPRHHNPSPAPAGVAGGLGRFPDQVIHTHVHLDRKVVGKAVNRFNADKKAHR